MGRTARTNCSPFDMAMNKYHCDIGSRLSATFLPEQYTRDDSENLTQDFFMLTIDSRRVKNLKQKVNKQQITSLEKCQGTTEASENSASKITIPASSTLSKTSSAMTTASDQENQAQEKRSFFDRLTCAVFQRKHMCSRCKRRSRSCISKKAFLGSEKRYTCFRCRELSHSVETRTDAQSKDSRSSNSASGKLHSSQSKDRLSKHRAHKKDSGYETVTSCSTVASSYSVFNTPANARHNTANLNNILSSERARSSKRNRNISKTKITSANDKFSMDIICSGTKDDYSSNFVDNSDSELSNFPTLDLDESHVDKTKYSGYIPEADHDEQSKSRPRSVLADTSNLDDISENGDSCYFAPRIIRVSQPEKVTLRTQKACYTCESTSKPCFRLPWEGGWICEDCLDGLH